MDAGVIKLSAANLQDLAVGLLFLISGVGTIAYRSLTSNLRRYDTSQWVTLGSPKLFKAKSVSDELRFFWYILSFQYRKNETRKIRISGDVILACFAAIWIISMCLLVFGDFRRYDFNLTFVKTDGNVGSELFSASAGCQSAVLEQTQKA